MVYDPDHARVFNFFAFQGKTFLLIQNTLVFITNLGPKWHPSDCPPLLDAVHTPLDAVYNLFVGVCYCWISSVPVWHSHLPISAQSE